MGFISPKYGIVHYHFGVSSFTRDDVCIALKEFRAKIADDVKVCLGLDNAKIHSA